MTYFIMSGRYDSVNNGLSNDNVVIHIMLMMFFFFTVIVMMNVLIALINHAFDDGDRTWERDWLQNRMRYVESAENMANDISGFFCLRTGPDTIYYYTATALQVREYKKTTQKAQGGKFPNAEFQTFVSETFGGGGQDWQHSKQREQEEVDANTGENRAMMEMFKHFQEEQRWMRKEQQEVYKALLTAHEEQKQAAEELRKEVALLKEQRQQ
ncbi:MAG: hypothetical protein J3R72DRAFT_445036 [Linnemannia gamsii]|nr:MAG: hypothetical protein J3R72DRAFT_445036 [Linnemannia gamsii]